MSEFEFFPIRLSLEVATAAMLLAAPVGTVLAWLQARRRYKLRPLVDALIMLPLVLPPSVVGFALVVAFGRHGALGSWLEALFDVSLVFTPAAAVLASCVVALPIVVKTAQPALESVPRELEQIGRSLGLSEVAVFFRITLPSAWRGILAATVLGYARAMGEFGATLMFAGNIPGRTNTVPLEIFASYQAGNDPRALFYVTVMTVFSCVVVFLAARLAPAGEPR